MKRGWIVPIFIVMVVISFVIKFIGCGKSAKNENVVVTVPGDSNFTPVQVKSYRPSSLPFSKKTSGVKLPKGVTEKNVKQVVSITLDTDHLYQDSSLEGKKPYGEFPHKIDIIETKAGEIFVAKDSLITLVSVTRFEPQVFSFGLRFGVGCSMGLGITRSPALRVLPMGIISLAEWNIHNYNFHAPIVAFDWDGVGIGIQTQLYHDIYVGVLRSWDFGGGGCIKGEIGVMF